MSGIGELAYTVLLGWMRGLVNWFWSVVSGGAGEGLQWFLSNWKLWLVILLGGGLVVDWMMWLVRWRPYRVFLRRFRKTEEDPLPENEFWDTGVGYYETETMQDTEPSDWTDMTLSTLSEIDPNWADGVFIDVEDMPDGLQAAASQPNGQYAKTYFYSDTYEEPSEAYQNAQSETGYWESDPADESESSQWEALPYEEEAVQWVDPASTVPYEDDGESASSDEAEYYADEEEPQADHWINLPNYQPPKPQEEEKAQYGRAALWPGAFPHVERMEADDQKAQEAEAFDHYEDEPSAEEMKNDPLFSKGYAEAPYRQSRMLRRLRKSDEDSSRRRSRQSKKEDREMPAFQKTRPQRLVQPVSATPEQSEPNDFRTVTGKPVKRQGLLRLAATDDEPIAGLPPMQVGDAFYPKAMPKNPDFSDDDGSY